MRELHPGLLAHRAARTRDLPGLAAALAHGAEVNWADTEDEGKTPLVQAVLGVSRAGAGRRAQLHRHVGVFKPAPWVACAWGPALHWRLGWVRLGVPRAPLGAIPQAHCDCPWPPRAP